MLGNLTALTELDLADNQLSALPDALGNLTALTQLNLTGNQLSALPDALGNLTALTQLNLAYNQLSALPDALGNLTALTRLDLFRNQLSALPDALGNLTALTQLDLAGNQLSALPTGLGELTELTVLNIADNSLPPEMLAAAAEGTRELLAFLRLIDTEGVQLAEVKLVLVGEGAVGKSSLLAALRGEPWVERRDQTHGLQIKPVEVEHAGQAITLTRIRE